MFSLIAGVLLTIVGVALFIVKVPDYFETFYTKLKNYAASMVVALGLLVGASGAVGYNEAGYCQHVRTIWGSESSACETGWYGLGWGRSSAWPHFITVANTLDNSSDGSSVSGPYRVRLADNWSGDVTQTTRFAIPQDSAQFLSMARTFRSPERLISTTLKPSVVASMDSVANMFTMEEYYAGGKRDQFKSEYKDAIEKGRAKVTQIEVSRHANVKGADASASDADVAKNTSEVGDTTINRLVIQKVIDEKTGEVVRVAHDYTDHGIVVASAILENVDPDDVFEQQIKARKDAASRRIVAREQRLEQEEQRLLAIQAGQTNVAKRQAEAQVAQIEQTTNAETTKKLALISAEKLREEARIAKETSIINLDKAKIDAKAVEVLADAEAYKKREIMKADGALAQKLEAWTVAQQHWAQAAANIKVPSTVFAGGNSNAGNALGTVDQFMQMMMVKSAKDLQFSPTIGK